MSGRTEVTPVGQLVLARLLIAGAKGATGTDFRKSLEPLLGHRWTGTALTRRIEATLAELTAAGLVNRLRKGKSVRDYLTPEGRQRILGILGLDQPPPKMTWDKLKKTYLAARALGLSAPKGEEAGRFAKDDGFRAALLKRQFLLPFRDYPEFKETLEALSWTLLGFSPGPKFNVTTVQSALLRRALGEDDPKLDSRPDPKKEATRLLARTVGARKSGTDELRLAALRAWIDDQQPPEAVTTEAEPPPGPEIDPPTFARRVVEAARSCPSGRFGDDKVFVVHIWRALRDDPAFAPIGLEDFKRRLAEANNARLLNLSRADMVEAMDPEDVRLSEIAYLGASFHFVRV